MAADVPAAVIRSVPQALDAPEARARGLIQTMQHPGVGPVSVVASPLRLENLPASPLPPPLLGEHTRNVLQNVLGRTEPEIQRLLASGVLYES